ncbi:MAG: winged helix-turn-helix domain-containing protein [Candidatus Aureabacteria bacterium]|nr:winged helix-turn-helix domain-containing protein [Candidatus Auribacterota bacterium]
MMWRTIGDTAGMVYRFLQKEKQATPTELIKNLKIPYDTLQMAIGWLARENKITIEKVRSTLTISLK